MVIDCYVFECDLMMWLCVYVMNVYGYGFFDV